MVKLVLDKESQEALSKAVESCVCGIKHGERLMILGIHPCGEIIDFWGKKALIEREGFPLVRYSKYRGEMVCEYTPIMKQNPELMEMVEKLNKEGEGA